VEVELVEWRYDRSCNFTTTAWQIPQKAAKYLSGRPTVHHRHYEVNEKPYIPALEAFAGHISPLNLHNKEKGAAHEEVPHYAVDIVLHCAHTQRFIP